MLQGKRRSKDKPPPVNMREAEVMVISGEEEILILPCRSVTAAYDFGSSCVDQSTAHMLCSEGYIHKKVSKEWMMLGSSWPPIKIVLIRLL